MLEPALALLLAAGAVAAGASAAPPRFDAHARFAPTGCAQAMSGSSVTVSGCTAKAPFTGSARGTLSIAYHAKLDLATGRGTQHGTLTLGGPSARDRLAVTFSGMITESGAAHGTWRAVARTGAFAKEAPRTGTYSSTTRDQGAHVSFDVRR